MLNISTTDLVQELAEQYFAEHPVNTSKEENEQETNDRDAK